MVARRYADRLSPHRGRRHRPLRRLRARRARNESCMELTRLTKQRHRSAGHPTENGSPSLTLCQARPAIECFSYRRKRSRSCLFPIIRRACMKLSRHSHIAVTGWPTCAYTAWWMWRSIRRSFRTGSLRASPLSQAQLLVLPGRQMTRDSSSTRGQRRPRARQSRAARWNFASPEFRTQFGAANDLARGRASGLRFWFRPSQYLQKRSFSSVIARGSSFLNDPRTR